MVDQQGVIDTSHQLLECSLHQMLHLLTHLLSVAIVCGFSNMFDPTMLTSSMITKAKFDSYVLIVFSLS